MRVVHVTKKGRSKSDNPIFRGDVDYQTVVGDESKDLSLSEVTFKGGAVNRWHVHTCDQILVITDGKGIVADGEGERLVEAGDVALIPANTRHWHGARTGEDMTHWSILANGKTTIVD